MRLAHFIRKQKQEIIEQWESFARTQLPAAAGMSDLALRNHAELILEAIAEDIETEQTPSQQYAKSWGLALGSTRDSAASSHGSLRHASGFTLLQLTAEYRALRATVLRLWMRHSDNPVDDTTNDIIRFNEAIDQALAESVITYSARVTRTRDLFLAILGHDLRAPLATMANAGELLKKPDLQDAIRLDLGAKVDRSATLMRGIIDDLLGFARVQLGSQIPIAARNGDLRQVCENALDDSRAVYPNCSFELHADRDLAGSFDSTRLHQLFTNLLLNAAQYRAKDSPVVLSVRSDADFFTARVHNFGTAIPEDSLESIFRPLTQLTKDVETDRRPKSSLGLGLFVAREIASAHGGSITVRSNATEGTEFTVRLPRKALTGQP